MIAGLLCALIGDLCLMGESDRLFLAGLIAFLCGHLAYAVAFMQIDGNSTFMLLSAVPIVILLLGTLLWLRPHLPKDMIVGVTAYVLVIAAMLLTASRVAGIDGGALIACGALGFAISDLAVARQQFVHRSKINGLWGTPLYFASQMLLALSIAVVT